MVDTLVYRGELLRIIVQDKCGEFRPETIVAASKILGRPSSQTVNTVADTKGYVTIFQDPAVIQRMGKEMADYMYNNQAAMLSIAQEYELSDSDSFEKVPLTIWDFARRLPGDVETIFRFQRQLQDGTIQYPPQPASTSCLIGMQWLTNQKNLEILAL